MLGMGNRTADLDVIAGMQSIRPAGNPHRVGSELSVLGPDRLGAGVELVEVLVGGLGDHER